jgi:hypothetical protein
MKIFEIINELDGKDVDLKPDTGRNFSSGGQSSEINQNDLRDMKIAYRKNPQFVALVMQGLSQPHIKTVAQAVQWAQNEVVAGNKSGADDVKLPTTPAKQNPRWWDDAQLSVSKEKNKKFGDFTSSSSRQSSLGDLIPGMKAVKAKIDNLKSKIADKTGFDIDSANQDSDRAANYLKGK